MPSAQIPSCEMVPSRRLSMKIMNKIGPGIEPGGGSRKNGRPGQQLQISRFDKSESVLRWLKVCAKLEYLVKSLRLL